MLPHKSESAPLTNDGPRETGVLRFGTFELEPKSRELRKGGRLIKLQPQHFQLLALLVARAGRVVTREEIQQALWTGQTFVDFDRSINFAINQIRAALDDDARAPRYIETLARQGYRFIAPVTAANQARDVAVGPLRWPRRRLLLWSLALAAIAFGLLASNAGRWRERLPRAPAGKPIESIAVLPLENLSHDPQQQYFADGMTDELITSLAKISALRVISRTSVMQYRGTKKPIPEIARELNVDSVLEGTVTRDQQRFRITAQLISAAPEKHLWAEQYEGDLTDVLTIQDSVAKAVAHEIQIKLTPREQTLLEKPRPVDPVAHEAYLKGQYLWELKGEQNLEKSQQYFQEAIKKDSSYALAWAGLADTYNYLSNWGVLPRQDAAPRARAAAQRALELDHGFVRPLVALAEVKMQYEWDWTGAERLFRQAIELNPNYGDAHHEYATYLAAVRRTDEAITEARKAHEVEPLNLEYAVNVPWKLYLAHRYDEAELESRKLQEWWPSFSGSYVRASIYLQNGRARDAIALLQQSAAESHRGALELMYLAHALGASGARSEARKILEEMQRLSQRRYIPPEYIAIVYEGLGERDPALRWFEKAYNEHSMNIWILPDPALDSIRSDLRFKNITRRMGLSR